MSLEDVRVSARSLRRTRRSNSPATDSTAYDLDNHVVLSELLGGVRDRDEVERGTLLLVEGTVATELGRDFVAHVDWRCATRDDEG